MLRPKVRGGVALARGAVRAVASVGAHAVWWLDYRIGGTPRRAPDDPRRGPSDGR